MYGIFETKDILGYKAFVIKRRRLGFLWFSVGDHRGAITYSDIRDARGALERIKAIRNHKDKFIE